MISRVTSLQKDVEMTVAAFQTEIRTLKEQSTLNNGGVSELTVDNEADVERRIQEAREDAKVKSLRECVFLCITL